MNEPQYTTTTIKPLACEREMYTNTFQNEDGEWVVELETNIQKYSNRCKTQGWTLVRECTHTDGTWVSAVWRAPAKALTIAKAIRPKRQMSEEQKKAVAERFAKIRESRKDIS